MPSKVLKQRRSYHGSDAWWFAATAVLVLIAIFLFTLLVAAFELRWGVIPAGTGATIGPWSTCNFGRSDLSRTENASIRA